MLNNYASYCEEVHICPHCKQAMSCCEAPSIHVGDGLGWGAEVMFICLNDQCSLYNRGWQHVEQQYGHSASYRYMELPGSKESNVMMVGSEDAFKASVINLDEVRKQNTRYQQEKEAVKALDTALTLKNIQPVLFLVLDEAADRKDRLRAIEIMGKMAEISVIDPVRNHKFRDPALENEANMALAAILAQNFMKECPYCMELIKSQARKCKHCQADLS